MKMICTLLILLVSVDAFAAGEGAIGFNFNGVLQNDAGAALPGPANVTFTVLDPTAACVLYEEAQTIAPDAGGAFNVKVGSAIGDASRTANDPANAWSTIFQNVNLISTFNAGCAAGYTPAPNANRRLRVTVNGTVLTPDFTLNAAPMASVADTLRGKTPTDFLNVRSDASFSLSQANLENVFSMPNYSQLLALIGGTSSQYMKASPTTAVGFGNQRLTDVASPTASTDAANKNYVDTQLGGAALNMGGITAGQTLVYNGTNWVGATPSTTDATKLPLAGGTMTGLLNMGSQSIINAASIGVAAGGVFKINSAQVLAQTNNNLIVGNGLQGTGDFNTAVGVGALSNNTLGAANTVVGSLAGQNIVNTTQNTLIGYQAGRSLTSGSGNVVIGASAGAMNLVSGSGNIYIGTAVDPTNASNRIAIGNLLFGDMAARTLGIGTQNPSSNLDIVSTSGTALLSLRTTASPQSFTFGVAPTMLTLRDDTQSLDRLTFTSTPHTMTFLGHVAASGQSPTLGTCGAGSVVTGASDARGAVALGTTSITSCTISFAQTYTTPPYCVVSWRDAATNVLSVQTTASQLTITFSSADANRTINYICMQ